MTNVAAASVRIRPVLVTFGGDEGADQAFVLACAKLLPGKPAVFLDGKACAPLLDGVELELVGPAGRTPVRLGPKGTAIDCDASTEPVPTVQLVGLPTNTGPGRYIVGRGVAARTGDVAAVVMEAIREVRPLQPLKREGDFGPQVSAQLDLDGDGVFEIVMSSGSDDHELFTSAGTSIATVGCYIG